MTPIDRNLITSFITTGNQIPLNKQSKTGENEMLDEVEYLVEKVLSNDCHNYELQNLLMA